MKRAVFGMGIALINHWPIIEEKFGPQFAIDNNPEKWGKRDAYTGLKCLSLNEIEYDEEIEALITVGDPYAIQAISKQLEALHIKHQILIELIDEWYASLSLPRHLDTMQINEKKIILFNTPEHDNIGDHLITLAEMQLLERYFKDYSIYEVTDIEFLKHHLKIRERVGKEDIILITGGGYAGSLWLYNGENNIRKIVSEYPDNRIVVLPQTVYFEENERGNIEYINTQNAYRTHRNLVLCAREKASYDLFVSLKGSDDRVYLMPDMALFYNNTCKTEKNNQLALICLRKDKESILDSGACNKIIKVVKEKGYEIKTISMHSGVFDGIKGRKNQVAMKLKELAGAQIIVTDTLHCMISSALVGTNCFAFDNLSGKVKNVYHWIENLDYINFCKDSIDITEVHGVNKYSIKDLDKYERALVSIIRGDLIEISTHKQNLWQLSGLNNSDKGNGKILLSSSQGYKRQIKSP